MKNKKILKVVGIIVVLFWINLIYYFSNQPASISEVQSNAVNSIFQENIILSTYLKIANESGVALFGVRKLAHMFLYFVLTTVVYKVVSLWNFKNYFMNIAISFVLVISYSCIDEWHQTFISGRSGSIVDVGVDSIGAIVAIFVIIIVQKLKNRKHIIDGLEAEDN